jgi:23S rRNA (guanosine2251-2'-O)-methyltransferase
VIAQAADSGTAPMIVALDGVTDPRNLGAVIRSAVAFGAHGVVIPERRSAGITATAWRTSAGTAAKLPIAQVTNLVRALKECKDAGLFVVGLDADGSTLLDDLEMATEPIVIVVGSEGRGLSRLVGETCDLTVSIPMSPAAESLNASVAAAVTLAEVARRRRVF